MFMHPYLHLNLSKPLSLKWPLEAGQSQMWTVTDIADTLGNMFLIQIICPLLHWMVQPQLKPQLLHLLTHLATCSCWYTLPAIALIQPQIQRQLQQLLPDLATCSWYTYNTCYCTGTVTGRAQLQQLMPDLATCSCYTYYAILYINRYSNSYSNSYSNFCHTYQHVPGTHTIPAIALILSQLKHSYVNWCNT